MDKIILSDGSTSTISTEEAFRIMYEVWTDKGPEWRIKIESLEFVWKAGCWMQL